ncbi:MAG: 30S ribosomal protein S14, partial [Methanocorpusculum sp.]|nr:30S ribosomal protein S14 [Methanocorpusculum sp.]
MAAKDNGKVQQKKFGRGANQCQLCGRKQGLVRRYNIYF